MLYKEDEFDQAGFEELSGSSAGAWIYEFQGINEGRKSG